MTEVGSFEAKTKLAELLERAAAGEDIVITRRGKPVARLVRVDAEQRAAAAIEELRRLRKDRTLGPLDWKQLRDTGRR